MFLSKYTVCDTQNAKFIKNQEASKLLSKFRIKTPPNRIPFLSPFLF